MRRSLVYRFYGRVPSALPRTSAAHLGQKWSGMVPERLGGKTMISAVFTSPSSIRRLNRLYRGIDRPTDVLSFSADGTGELGDLVVCSAVAAREAERRGVGLREELIRLLAHGTLHLLGLDHITQRQRKRMFGLQEKMVHEII